MPFDYKKEYKELYSPTKVPSIITVPAMHFVAVQGMGDPNATDGEYAQALKLLYGISYTLKMSKLSKTPLIILKATWIMWSRPSKDCGGWKTARVAMGWIILANTTSNGFP